MQTQTQSKNKGLYWLIFFATTGLLFFSIFMHFSYLTLILPFMLTAFVKAMDII